MQETWWFRLILPCAFVVAALLNIEHRVGFSALLAVDLLFLMLSMFLIGGIIREKEMEHRK